MKKIYQTPATIIVKVRPSSAMMAVSGFNETLDTTGDDGSDALVKGGGRNNFSVWNDDWSE
jgi:hypothetical protein